jgi:hypothetical protein
VLGGVEGGFVLVLIRVHETLECAERHFSRAIEVLSE